MDVSSVCLLLEPERLVGGIDLLELQLQKAVSCCGETGNHTWVLCKRSKTSQPLSGLASPSFHFFKFTMSINVSDAPFLLLPHLATDSTRFVD